MPNSVTILARTIHHYLSFSMAILLAAMPPLYGFLVWAEVAPTIALNLEVNGQSVNFATGLGVILSLIGISIIGLTVGNARAIKLENSHRNFHIGMDDVEMAFLQAFAADKAGMFRLPNLFDAVRERMLHLRNLPDLQGFEPDILALAAQMSQVSAKVAQAFSEEKVAHAQAFIAQRLDEVVRLERQITTLRELKASIKKQALTITTDKAALDKEAEATWNEIVQILASLGYSVAETSSNVTRLEAKPPS